MFTTLTMTAALGVNDGEIGAVIRRAMATPYVGGVTIQPVFGSGRSAGIDPNERVVKGLMEFVAKGVRTSVALSREESERRHAAEEAEAA